MTIRSLDSTLARSHFARVREVNPLVLCLTNTVTVALSADVLAASGASPAMIPAREEAPDVAHRCDALLVNIGTMTAEDFSSMRLTARAATYAHRPWVLDPVGAGLSVWRDSLISRLLLEQPTVIRANASEVLALVGESASIHGVDSTLGSETALEAAQKLAHNLKSIIVLTGATDYITDATDTIAVTGGSPLAHEVVGTGCSLSALVAAYVSQGGERLTAAACACALAKRAAERAGACGYGAFRARYLDAIEAITKEACS